MTTPKCGCPCGCTFALIDSIRIGVCKPCRLGYPLNSRNEHRPEPEATP